MSKYVAKPVLLPLKANYLARQFLTFKRARRYAFTQLSKGYTSNEVSKEIGLNYFFSPAYIYQVIQSAQELLNPQNPKRESYLNYLKFRINQLRFMLELLVDTKPLWRNELYKKEFDWQPRSIDAVIDYLTYRMSEGVTNFSAFDIQSYEEFFSCVAYLNWLESELYLYQKETSSSIDCSIPEYLKKAFNPIKIFAENKKNCFYLSIGLCFPSDKKITYIEYIPLKIINGKSNFKKEKFLLFNTNVSLVNATYCELIWYNEELYLLWETASRVEKEEKTFKVKEDDKLWLKITAASLILTFIPSLTAWSVMPENIHEDAIITDTPVSNDKIDNSFILANLSKTVTIFDALTGQILENVQIIGENDEILGTTDNDGKVLITPNMELASSLVLNKNGYQRMLLIGDDFKNLNKIELIPLMESGTESSPMPTFEPSSSSGFPFLPPPVILKSPVVPISPTPAQSPVEPIILPPAANNIIKTSAPTQTPKSSNINQNTTTTTPKATSAYVVKKGDSLSLIAQRTLGNYKLWQEIYDLNRNIISNPDLIYPGQKIKLPSARNVYLVQRGDCLFKIAGQHLNHTSRWYEIYQMNRRQIRNPNIIYPGQKLFMPSI